MHVHIFAEYINSYLLCHFFYSLQKSLSSNHQIVLEPYPKSAPNSKVTASESTTCTAESHNFVLVFSPLAASLPSKTRKLFCEALNHVHVLTSTVFTPTSRAAVTDEGQSGVSLHFSHNTHPSRRLHHGNEPQQHAFHYSITSRLVESGGYFLSR